MFFSHSSVVGVDIGDRSIEVAELREKNKQISVVSLGRSNLAPGIVDRGSIKNPQLLKEAFLAACASASPTPIKPTRVVLASPESKTFIHIVRLLEAKATEIMPILKEEVAKNIPLDSSEVIFTHSMLSDHEVMIAATEKSILADWEKFFRDMQIIVDAFDLEPQAVFRSVYKDIPASPVLLCDLGAASTNISVFSGGNIIHSYTIPIGGDTVSHSLATTLGVDAPEAERLKTIVGFTEPESKAFQVVRQYADKIVREIGATLVYVKEKKTAVVAEVVISGGVSRMPGLVEYIARHLSCPVRAGRPFFEAVGAESGTDVHLYLEAIGLALRPWLKNGLEFTLGGGRKGWFSR